MTGTIRYVFIAFLLNAVWISGPYAQVDILPLQQAQTGSSDTTGEKPGESISTEKIKELMDNPALQGLSPEEIKKGAELLREKEQGAQFDENKEAPSAGPVGARHREGAGSLFDRYRAVGTYQDISTDLRPFGFDFFAAADRRSLVPRRDIPVSPEYVIGPGDEVKIMLWGRVNAQYDLVVDKDGNISVPQIGPLQVTGMRFDEMKQYLTDQTDQIVGAKINVTIGTLKSIQVFVLGEVRSPGSYALDSYSTITTAILAAGGPTKIGSLRSVQLKRNGKSPVVMDFYDFLMKGDKSRDAILSSGDVVFVPTAGPLVGVAGNVKRPAIYELKDTFDLLHLFDMAGGLIPTAYTQQIQVERIERGERQTVIDIDDKDLTKSGTFNLQDGDLVKVFSIVDRDMNAVYLRGNVKRPGKYEFRRGMKVRDLIETGADLLGETHYEYALIKRLRLPSLEPELIPFDLGALLFRGDEKNNVPLEPQDIIYVFSKWVFRDKPVISLSGEVRKPGSFPLTQNYRLKDAILEAGGLTKDASLDRGEIFRTSGAGDVSQIYFNVGQAMAGDLEENLLLEDGDSVVIHSLWEGRVQETVSIEGEVKSPGQYPLGKEMRVSDLVFSAGDLLESAYLEEAEISSFVIEHGERVRLDHRVINLGKALDNDTEHNVPLKPRDRLFVKRIPEWQDRAFVTVNGEVRFPGKYLIRKGENLSSLLSRAGGYSDSAYLRGAVFTRESVRALQQKGLDEMIERIEREMVSAGAVGASTAMTAMEVEARKAEREQKQAFIESLRKLRANGRMSIRLSHLRLLKGSPFDIDLQDGDSLYIPRKNNVVNIAGATMSPGAFIYSDKLGYRDYIEMAGGYAPFADENNVYVLKADGTAKKVSGGLINWNISRSRWETDLLAPEEKDIEPGDTIIVPEKLERIAWMREVKDITQILYQVAVTAGVLIVAF